MWPWIPPSSTFNPKRHSLGGPGPWAGHLGFAYDLVAAGKPKLLVELGAFYGESYFGFCQAVEEQSVSCTCYAVDTWQGDAHGGFYGEDIYSDVDAYNRTHYSSFSHLMRMTFDQAVPYFSDGSIDVLHIDGHHSYESVRSDFESWIPKVRPGGIILLHDIGIRTAGFGVWRFWEELCASYPHFAFAHSAGLGVVMNPGAELRGRFLPDLLAADAGEQTRIRRYYAALAERFHWAFDSAQLRKKSEPLSCAVQVFYSLGQDYTEENSVVRIVEMGQRQRVTFELPAGIPEKPLRIDPAERACIIELSEICVWTCGRSAVLWKWDGSGPVPIFQVGGTARVLASMDRIIILSDGIDPQIFIPDIGGEVFARPVELDLVLQITAWLEFNGKIIPLANRGEMYASLELDRASVREEMASIRTELVQRFLGVDELNRKIDGIATAVRHTSGNLETFLMEELARVHAGALAANIEIKEQLSQVTTRMHSEFEMLRTNHTEIRKDHTEETERLFTELKILRASALAADTEIAELRNRLESEGIRRKELEESWSWRVTAPARFVLGRFGRNRTR